MSNISGSNNAERISGSNAASANDEDGEYLDNDSVQGISAGEEGYTANNQGNRVTF